MTMITARIPEHLDRVLTILAKETDRNKSYIVKRALELYIEEKADLLIALSRLEKGEETVSLEEIEKKYGLED